MSSWQNNHHAISSLGNARFWIRVMRYRPDRKSIAKLKKRNAPGSLARSPAPTRTTTG